MIQIDSREHQKVIDGIKKAFDAAGEKWFVSKLYVGDYMNYDNPRLLLTESKISLNYVEMRASNMKDFVLRSSGQTKQE